MDAYGLLGHMVASLQDSRVDRLRRTVPASGISVSDP